MRRGLRAVALSGALVAAVGVVIAVAPGAQAASWNTPPAAAIDATGTDTQPPTVPTNLSSRVACNPLQVTLAWTASTDNVGVTGYDIFAANSASGPFSQVGTSTTTTVALPLRFLNYEVRSRDAAGNVSAFTAPVLAPPPPCGPPPSSCTAVYSPVGNPWSGGFQGQVTVTNTGTNATRSWTVTLTFANGQAITQLWGAGTASTASPYTITNLSYNGALGPNASTTFGFLASWNGTNTAPTVSCTSTP